MLILMLRTDNPQAELYLFDGQQQLDACVWQAHRELSAAIHHRLQELLERQHKTLPDIAGIVCYKGPGSFTGLRIGFSVANALAYGLHIPIVSTNGTDWQSSGIAALLSGQNDTVALPEYGAPVHITQQRK